MVRHQPVIFILALSLAACATPPRELAGNAFPDVTPNAVQTHPELIGQTVRWGGILKETLPSKGQTCFEVVSRPLDDEARPIRGDQSDGRFIACSKGFFDPTIYEPKRAMTFVGTLEPPISKKIKDYDYLFPQLEAQVVYLWPKRPPIMAYPDPYGFGGYYGIGPWGFDPMMGPMMPMMPF